MKKTLILILKVLMMLAIVGFLGHEVHKSLTNPDLPAGWWRLEFSWGYAPVAVLGMMGVYLSSGLVWIFLARRMGDRSPRLRLLGAYTYSQMGKYVPGKIVLLLMRIERAGRYGMGARVCTLSTLLENALYMVSGGLAGVAVLLVHTRELAAVGKNVVLVDVAAGVAVVGLLAACHPAVFYSLVNKLLVKMKKEPVPEGERLRMGTLVVSVGLFMACWVCGGVSMWAAARLVVPGLPVEVMPSLMGAFALSVIVGMASFLPGGLGTRDATLALFVGWELGAYVGEKAAVLATVAVLGQRLAQIASEVVLGLIGGAVTGRQAETEAGGTERQVSAPSGESDLPAKIQS